MHGTYDNLSIYENIIMNNSRNGVYSYNCNDNTIIGNSLSGNGNTGLIMEASINYNITDNSFMLNNQHGIYLTINSDNNNFFSNQFIQNSFNAEDNGNSNNWDNGVNGNFWDDYNGLDLDDNGIGDNPYNLSGSADTNSICKFTYNQSNFRSIASKF